MKKTKWIAAAAVMAIVAAFSGCSGALNNELNALDLSESQYEGMRFAVLLPGNNSRVAYYEESDATKYDVLLEKDGVAVVEEKNKAPGSKVYLPVADEGTYKIKVIAYQNTTVIGEGEESRFIKFSDGDVNVDITIQPKVKAGVNVGIQWGDPDFVFVKGSTVDGGNKYQSNFIGEYIFSPGRSVKIENFYICKHEVTQAEYEAVMGENPSDEINKNYPVENVTWFAAIIYCNKKSIAKNFTPCYAINGKTNPDEWGTPPISSRDENLAIYNAVTCDFTANGYRLPTEAEWEYAAIGGKSGTDATDPTDFAGTNNYYELENYAWCEENSELQPHEVGKKLPNSLGLYDMSGNVSEWCWDWYGAISSETPNTGASTGTYRIQRGHSYEWPAVFCSVALRDGGVPFGLNGASGFRVVRSAQ